MLEAYAPGRAELLGNHTDYNEGLVLAIAVNCGTSVTVAPLPDNRIVLRSKDFPEKWEGTVKSVQPGPSGSWYNYVLGVVEELGRRQVFLGGFELEAHSVLPIGAGLSSSAALEAATALALKKLYPYEMEALEIARACQAAEHHYTGVRCGLLDQISVLMSRMGHATFIDCRNFEVRHLPLPPDVCFVIVNSGVKHALVAGEYNERRASCEEAARLLGRRALRDVSTAELEKFREKLPETVWKRARHITGENERVAQAVGFLAQGKIEAFGGLMFESHESSRRYFENSCPELDFLVETARGLEGCLGARLSGGGFGGATINLVRKGSEDSFCAGLAQAARQRLGHEPSILVTEACGGGQ